MGVLFLYFGQYTSPFFRNFFRGGGGAQHELLGQVDNSILMCMILRC